MRRPRQQARYRPSVGWWFELWLVSLVLPAVAMISLDRLASPVAWWDLISLVRIPWLLSGPVVGSLAILKSDLDGYEKFVWVLGTVFLMPLVTLIGLVGSFQLAS